MADWTPIDLNDIGGVAPTRRRTISVSGLGPNAPIYDLTSDQADKYYSIKSPVDQNKYLKSLGKSALADIQPVEARATVGPLLPTEGTARSVEATLDISAPRKSIKSYTPDEAWNLVQHFENPQGNPNFGYGNVDISKYPKNKYGFPLWPGSYNTPTGKHTSAAGLGQFEEGTWNQYAEKLGITDFSPASQRKVFDALYADRGFQPWTVGNKKLTAALGLKWNPTPEAIAAEQNRSGVDVVHMKPHDYLSMVDKIEPGDSNDTKRAILMQSLNAGEGIQSLPSLDVKQSGDNDLSVVDYDGRNRAQAAIDEGIPSIPVSIRGVPKGIDIGKIKGTTGKELPYTFDKVPRLGPIGTEQAQRIVPEAFPAGGPGREAQAQQQLASAPTGPQPSVFDQAPPAIPPTLPAPTATGKPDFYPQIAAGINRDIVSPTAAPYRGLAVPNPTTDLTATNRIGAANALSAGNVGLPSPTPNMLTQFLGALNPISSARAAEPASDWKPINLDQITQQPAQTPTSDWKPIQLLPLPETNPLYGLFPGGQFLAKAARDVAPPVINALTAPLRAPIADIAAAAPLGGQTLPSSMEDWRQRRNALLSTSWSPTNYAGQIPETQVGQAISRAIGYIPNAIASGANALMQMGGIDPEAVAPYADIAMDIGLPSSGGLIGNAAMRGALSPLVRSPEMRAISQINREQPMELAQGGATPAALGTSVASAQARGVPATGADFIRLGGPQESLLMRSLAASPERAAQAEDMWRGRIEGQAGSRPADVRPGSQLERTLQRTESALGSGSAPTIARQLRTEAARHRVAFEAEQKREARLKNALDAELAVLGKRSMRGVTSPKAIRLASDLQAARRQKIPAEREMNRYASNEIALARGGQVLQTSRRGAGPTRVEDIQRDLSRFNSEQTRYYRLGASDAVRQAFKNTSTKGRVPSVTLLPQNTMEKISAVFGGSTKAADEFLTAMQLEQDIADRSERYAADELSAQFDQGRAGRVIPRIGEAAAHALIHAPHGYASYWPVRLGRNVWEYLRSGGYPLRESTRNAIIDFWTNPQQSYAASARNPNLFAIPARTPALQNRLNALANIGTGGAYLSAEQAVQPQSQLSSDWIPIR